MRSDAMEVKFVLQGANGRACCETNDVEHLCDACRVRHRQRHAPAPPARMAGPPLATASLEFLTEAEAVRATLRRYARRVARGPVWPIPDAYARLEVK